MNKRNQHGELHGEDKANPFFKSMPMAITNFRRRRKDGSVTPILSDTDVEIAKEFVDENEK